MKSANRVEALTGVRALAGLYLLSFHFAQPLFARAPGWAQTLRQSGYVATSFFLMLSGFVLTIAYGRKLADGRLDARGFVVARLARLYPIYLLSLVMMLPFAVVHRWGVATGSFGDASLRYKLATGVANATMSHVLVPRLSGSWNVPGWCVSVEMWLYFAFPLVTVSLLERRTRAILGVLAGSWGAALALSIAYTVVQPDGFRPDHQSSAFWLTLFKFTPYTRWPELLFGIALGALWLRLPAERRGERFATPLIAGGALAALAILACSPHIPYTMLHNGTLLPLYALVVWGVMLGRGPLHRALSLRPLTAIGDSSYVLYLLQLPLMEWLVLVGRRDYRHLDAPFAAAAIAVIVGSAIAVHFLVERRAQAWLRPRLERWAARVTSPAPKRAAVAPIVTSATS
ncbi:MAG TPA: acyltransferase [Polyangia bacterium]